MYCSLTGQGINQTRILPLLRFFDLQNALSEFRNLRLLLPRINMQASDLIGSRNNPHLPTPRLLAQRLERTELSLDHHALRLLLHAHSLRLSPKTQDWMVRRSAGSYRSYCCCMMCFCHLLIVRTISPA